MNDDVILKKLDDLSLEHKKDFCYLRNRINCLENQINACKVEITNLTDTLNFYKQIFTFAFSTDKSYESKLDIFQGMFDLLHRTVENNSHRIYVLEHKK